MQAQEIRLEISNFKVATNDSRFIVKGQIMTTELIPEDILKRDIPQILHKEARIEHSVIEFEPYALVGTVVNVWWDDKTNAPWAEIEVFDNSSVEKQLREDLIKDQALPLEKRKYKGFSIGIVSYSDSQTGKLLRIFPREVSFTESPVCEICTIDSINTGIVEYNMSKSEAEVLKELLKEKDSKTELLIKQHEAKIKEFSAAHEIYAAKLAEKDSIIEEKIKEVETLKFSNAELKKENEKLELENMLRDKIPLVEARLNLLGLKQGSEIYNKKKEYLMCQTVDNLKNDLEDLKLMSERFSQSGNFINGLNHESFETNPDQRLNSEKYSHSGTEPKTSIRKDKIGGLM